MKVSELIEELKKMPQELDVCITDWQKNVEDDFGEGSGVGIYPTFEVEHITEVVADSKPFVSLTFDTDPPKLDGYKRDNYSQIE